ncbi:MAG: four helix bundle protein [Acidobacteriota bacterium]
MRDFRKIQVWEKAHHLTLDIYRATAQFPREERYGLTSQIRRCSSSIPANIAEGFGLNGDPDLARFLQISMGSACELEYYILLAKELHLLPDPTYDCLAERVIEVKCMLTGLLLSVRATKRFKN